MIKQVFLIGLLFFVAFVSSTETDTFAQTEIKTVSKNQAADQAMEQSSVESESEMKLPPGVKKSDFRRKTYATFSQEFTYEETKNIFGWSMGFWFRWSARDPFRSIEALNGGHQFLCGVSEMKNPDQRSYGYNNLGMVIGQYASGQTGFYSVMDVPFYYWTHSTSIGENVEPQPYKFIKKRDFDSTWIYLYVYQSQNGARLGFTLYSSRYGQYYSTIETNINHYTGTNRKGPLGFYIGGHPNNVRWAFPGYFYDINIMTVDNANAAAVVKSDRQVWTDLINKNRKPPQMNPDPNYVQIIGDIEQKSTFTDQFNENSPQYKKVYKFAGAEEYSIQGWFKLNSDTQFLPDAASAPFSLLVRVSLNEHAQTPNDDGFSALNLVFDNRKSQQTVFVKNSYMSNPNFARTGASFKIPDPTQYFWIYAGHNALTNYEYYYIRQGAKEYFFQGFYTIQFIPKFFGVYIGKDDGQSTATLGWNGVIRNLYLRVGKGAFNTLGVFDDNFINMKDMNCATLYSDCMYQGNSYQVCNSQNSFDPNFPVWSVKLPFGKKLKLYSQANMGGNAVEFTESQECLKKIDFGKVVDKKLIQLEYRGIRFLENHETENMINDNLAIHYHDPEQTIN